MGIIGRTKEIGSQAKEKEITVNGAGVTTLFKSKGAITHNDSLAKFNFRAKGKWINGAHNPVTINDFYGAIQTHDRSQGDIGAQDTHGLKGDVRNGYEKINVTSKVISNAPKEKIKELIEFAQKRSPVLNPIPDSNPVEVLLQEWVEIEIMMNKYALGEKHDE